MRPLAPWVRPLPLLACLVLAGCDDPLPAVGFVGPEACVDPALGTLEYFEDTMVPELFAPYCLPCHSTDRSGSERHGAPSYLDFDDFESAKSVNAAVWTRVAAREMPPMAATPSTEELELLVAWLDCTAPATGLPRDLAPTCPDAALTYDADAAPIFNLRCTGCHSSALAGSDRNGAPLSANYDSLQGVRAVGGPAIWQWLRIEAMPFGGPPLPESEALTLHAWLSCGAPE